MVAHLTSSLSFSLNTQLLGCLPNLSILRLLKNPQEFQTAPPNCCSAVEWKILSLVRD